MLCYLQTELDSLRARFEKVEKDKVSLQQSNDKLEGRVSGRVCYKALAHM